MVQDLASALANNPKRLSDIPRQNLDTYHPGKTFRVSGFRGPQVISNPGMISMPYETLQVVPSARAQDNRNVLLSDTHKLDFSLSLG